VRDWVVCMATVKIGGWGEDWGRVMNSIFNFGGGGLYNKGMVRWVVVIFVLRKVGRLI